MGSDRNSTPAWSCPPRPAGAEITRAPPGRPASAGGVPSTEPPSTTTIRFGIRSSWRSRRRRGRCSASSSVGMTIPSRTRGGRSGTLVQRPIEPMKERLDGRILHHLPGLAGENRGREGLHPFRPPEVLPEPVRMEFRRTTPASESGANCAGVATKARTRDDSICRSSSSAVYASGTRGGQLRPAQFTAKWGSGGSPMGRMMTCSISSSDPFPPQPPCRNPPVKTSRICQTEFAGRPATRFWRRHRSQGWRPPGDGIGVTRRSMQAVVGIDPKASWASRGDDSRELEGGGPQRFEVRS